MVRSGMCDDVDKMFASIGAHASDLEGSEAECVMKLTNSAQIRGFCTLGSKKIDNCGRRKSNLFHRGLFLFSTPMRTFFCLRGLFHASAMSSCAEICTKAAYFFSLSGARCFAEPRSPGGRSMK